VHVRNSLTIQETAQRLLDLLSHPNSP